MIGGRLEIGGEYDDSLPDSPLTGRMTVDNFRIVRAPLLVQLLSVMALTGALDVLQGDGLAFNILDAPFTLKNGLTQEDGRRRESFIRSFGGHPVNVPIVGVVEHLCSSPTHKPPALAGGS